jgi:phosphonate transport system substrate-binding protein
MLRSVSPRTTIVVALAALSLGIATLGGCGGGQSDAVLKFTAIPDQNTTELRERFQPLAKHLSEVLGVTVEYVPARDYQASVEMFRNGDVHLAWFGGLTGVQARAAVEGARAIAQGQADPRYYSYFIAHESTGLERSDTFPMEIAGLTFAFGSESSTSGRLMPEYFIRQFASKSPEEFFTEPFVFSGSHDKTVELVESGQYQAGVVNYKVYERRVQEGQTDPETVRVIWKTPFYADYNFTAHPALETIFGEGFIDRLQTALVAIDDESLLAALPRKALIPARNGEFAGIEAVARELGMMR